MRPKVMQGHQQVTKPLKREREREKTIEYVKFAGNLVFFDTIFAVVRDIRTK